MKLRKLEEKDAPLMFEWMHDIDVVDNLQTDFMNKTIEDCYSFIKNQSKENLHLAVVDEYDEYMGTVSLKNIHGGTAEFAIVIRKQAMGKGYSKYAMSNILEYGFSKLRLQCIYWYVDRKNTRAIKFYDKYGYQKTDLNTLLEEVQLIDKKNLESKPFDWYWRLKKEEM